MRKYRDRIYSVLLALIPIQAQLWYAALFPQGGWGVNIPWLSLCRCSPTEVGPAPPASVRFRPSADTRWYRLRGYCVTLGSYAHLCTTTWRRISIETVSQQSSIMDSPIWLNMMTPWHGSAFCIIDQLWGESSGRHRFPSQRAVIRGFDFFVLVRASCWTNNRVSGDWRRDANETSP